MSPHSPVSVGLSGWDFPHWNLSVFPASKGRHFHGLDYLARFFDVLEIHASACAPLRPEVSRYWLRTVAAHSAFRFNARLWRRFTHDRVLDKSDIERFHEGLRPIAESGKLGCLLVQFPWSFRFNRENREYLIQLRRTFSVYPLVAETPHASWSAPEALGTFIDYHIGFANIDQAEGVKTMPPTQVLTSEIGYMRLYGRDRAAEDGSAYLYPATQLAEWKQRIDRIRAFANAVYVVFANDGGGRSVVNALQMRSLIDGLGHRAPSALQKRFGAQLHPYLERPGQEPLFALPEPAVAPAPRRAVA